MATEKKKGLTSTDLEKMLKGGAPDVDMLSDGLRLAAEEIVRYRKPRGEPSGDKEYRTNTIRGILNDYREAVSRRVCASIDAGACGTSSDFAKARKREDEEAEAEDTAVEELFKMVLAAAKYGSL